MNIKKIVILVLTLFLGVGVSNAQYGYNYRPNKAYRYNLNRHYNTNHHYNPNSYIPYRGADVRTFKNWAERELRDDFRYLKSQRVRVYGVIRVNFEVRYDGRVIALRHEDSRARGRVLNGRVSYAINKLITKQRWSVRRGMRTQRYSFVLAY